MPNSVAEAYLLILRSTMIPIAGEAVPIPFNEQIELDGWDWDMKWDEKHGSSSPLKRFARRIEGEASPAAANSAAVAKSPFAGKNLVRAITDMQANGSYQQDERDQRVRRLVEDALKEQQKLDKAAAAAGEKKTKAEGAKAGAAPGKEEDEGEAEDKLHFSFKKNVDLATTQLLNSMKQAEVMPRAIITLFHRSANAPVTLAITFKNVVLTGYALSVDVSDTMADLKEEWTCTFNEVEYVYQNRPAAAGPNFVTQGTARVFKMLSKGLTLP